MTTPKPADLQRTELTRHFKACVPFLRHDTLQRVVDVIFAMVIARSVHQSDLCAHLPGPGSLDAKKRRVERGCRDPQLTEPVFLAFLLALLPPGELLLTMDRTTGEWFRFLSIKRAIRIRKNEVIDELRYRCVVR